MVDDSRLDPRTARFWKISVELAWSDDFGRLLLGRFLDCFAVDPRTSQAYEQLTDTSLENLQRDYQDGLVDMLAHHLLEWLRQNNERAIKPRLPSEDELIAILGASVEEYFEGFASNHERN